LEYLPDPRIGKGDYSNARDACRYFTLNANARSILNGTI
jgi:hypothetical protein